MAKWKNKKDETKSHLWKFVYQNLAVHQSGSVTWELPHRGTALYTDLCHLLGQMYA